MTTYLAEHCIPGNIEDPERPAYSVLAVEAFLERQRRIGKYDSVVTVDRLSDDFVPDFVAFRRAQGIADSTIRRDLGTVAAAVGFAVRRRTIAAMPFIQPMTGRGKVSKKAFAYSLPQLAAILDAGRASPHRHHVHLFVLTMFATHARTEAIQECDLDLQYQDGVIDWLVPGEEQTKKRRSMMPVGPTLEAWLKGRKGKLIQYRVERAQRTWADPDVPEYVARPTARIKHGFERTLIAAGAVHPSLRLRRPVLDDRGAQLMREVKRLGPNGWVPALEPVWEGIGSPNTIRHTIRTQLSRIGVNQQLIRAAAGHAPQGIDAHYTHFEARRDFKEFTDGVEQLFDELREYTTSHLHTQCTPKVVDLAAHRAGRNG